MKQEWCCYSLVGQRRQPPPPGPEGGQSWHELWRLELALQRAPGSQGRARCSQQEAITVHREEGRDLSTGTGTEGVAELLILSVLA